MDPVSAVRWRLLPAREGALANVDFASPLYAPTSETEPIPLGLDALNREDPEKAREVMNHFMSHVDAECFISLLQIQDPMPFDHQKRAEWRRYYHQLHDVLETPVLSDGAEG
jgi:hypothetical protein